jgi:sulfane dehydrogenase subunit SoxC
MTSEATKARFRTPGGEGQPAGDFHREEVQLALRNRGIPLEALRYDVTPTGLHYLLVHFDIPYVEAGAWSLAVGGLVEKPRALSLSEIMARPARTLTVTLECAGNGRALMKERSISQPWFVEAVSTAEWTGASLGDLLEECGIKGGAVDVVFRGMDEGVQGEEVQYYERSLSLEEALQGDVLLAYAMNGAPLQPQHGFPLRLVVPGWYGMASVKWLNRIEVIDHAFEGYQMLKSYRYSQTEEDAGSPVDRIRVRALMIPPGMPDFLTRARLLSEGLVTLNGRAWAGKLAVSRVEVSTDGGRAWTDANLEKKTTSYGWQAWSFEWRATPGRHDLLARATDEAGSVQPLDQWNYYGMGNNMTQRIEVIVE